MYKRKRKKTKIKINHKAMFDNYLTLLDENDIKSLYDSVNKEELYRKLSSFGINQDEFLVHYFSIDNPPMFTYQDGEQRELMWRFNEVVIPDGVLELGNNHFGSTHLVQKIKFPQSLRRIKSGCFNGCKKLYNFKFSIGLFIVEPNCFINLPKLLYIKFPRSLGYYDGSCFTGCSRLFRISMPTKTIIINPRDIVHNGFFDCHTRRYGGCGFHVSKYKIEDHYLMPRVPSSTGSTENNNIKRVCFGPSIRHCLLSTSQAHGYGIGDVLYVYSTDYSKNCKPYYPTIDEVPDVKLTKEVWITKPVMIKFYALIQITGFGEGLKWDEDNPDSPVQKDVFYKIIQPFKINEGGCTS